MIFKEKDMYYEQIADAITKAVVRKGAFEGKCAQIIDFASSQDYVIKEMIAPSWLGRNMCYIAELLERNNINVYTKSNGNAGKIYTFKQGWR